MKKYRTYIIIGVILIILAIGINAFKNRTTTINCTRSYSVYKGFSVNEELELKVRNDKIKNIKLHKTVVVNKSIGRYEGYVTNVEKTLSKAYAYLNTALVKVKDNGVVVDLEIDREGIVLNNLLIKSAGNNTNDLNYSYNADLKSNSGLKINEKYDESKLIQFGLTCE